jgi:hypothetical protein
LKSPIAPGEAMSLALEHVEAPTDDVRMLIGELDAELNGSYVPEQRHGLSIARIFQPGLLFFIARLNGDPAVAAWPWKTALPR